MKKFLATILTCMLITANTSTVFAYQFPKSVWKPDDAYRNAVNAGDYYGIINYGCQVMDILSGEPQIKEVLEFAGSRCEAVAKAYESLGQYENSAKYFAYYSDYAAQLGFDDAVRIAKEKARQYTPQIELFTPASYAQVNYGARNEPEKGIRYGLTTDSASIDSVSKSMMLIYMNFGNESEIDYIRKRMNDASGEGVAVEFAWNVDGEGNEIGDVIYNQSHIDNVVYLLKQFPDIPIYVRFGAEFDVWSAKTDPETFKTAFRYIADTIHWSVPNAAVVWSPNMVSSWDMNIDEYYPGDEYVDWVGMSLYLQRYFLGQRDDSANGKLNELLFFSGSSANPVIAIEHIINNYGTRKPVMLSESGVSHYINTMGEDVTPWAQAYLRKLLTNLPMMYPQIKLIAYFDKVMPETNNYAVSANPAMLDTYKALTNQPWYIHGNSGSALSFKKHDSVFETGKANTFMTYVHTYGADEPKITYFVDGTWYASRDYAPYTCNIAFSSPGEHSLRVSASSGGNVLYEKEYRVFISDEISIMVNDMKILSDVPPMLINNRTLVPVRLIAESLGAEVFWNEATSEVTVTKGSDVIKLVIGVPEISKNGATTAIDVAPEVINGRTMLPVRAVAEALMCQIDWVDEQNLVSIIN